MKKILATIALFTVTAVAHGATGVGDRPNNYYGPENHWGVATLICGVIALSGGIVLWWNRHDKSTI